MESSDDEATVNDSRHAERQSGTAFRNGGRVDGQAARETEGDTSQGTDPYSNFTVPQDADVSADAPDQTTNPTDREESPIEDTNARSQEVTENPAATADEPPDAEEMAPEPPD
jgi:hypothetical protein